jgi:flagellar assembly factor FliW
MSEPGTSDEKLKVESTRFGPLEVPVRSVIHLVGGIIGFPNLIRYTLLEYNPPFSWLQSLDRADMAFVVVNAAEFGEEYSFALPTGDRDLELTEKDEVAIINLVSVRPDPMMTTVNLKAPVIVNLRNMRGRQVVLDNPKFPVRMPLWVKDDSEKAKE